MKNNAHLKDLLLLLICFIVSRVLAAYSGLHFDFNALYDYWQYLDLESLRNGLLSGLYYQHSQPPAFNLLLGIILKISGQGAPVVFAALWYLISFTNCCILYKCLAMSITGRLPLIVSLVYLLAPATILFEQELFYTSFISFWLLLATFACMHLGEKKAGWYTSLLFISLSVLCLTRSMYHLFWLAGIGLLILFLSRRRSYFRRLVFGTAVSILLVGGWYAKNYFIFGSFSASSWIGINFGRIVFHDSPIKDSSNIAAIHPFYPIAYYKRYIRNDYTKFSGLNDRVLLAETKNGSFVNMNHVGYLEVSKEYMQASLRQVKAHPNGYLNNVFRSMIIFFTPASSYYKLDTNSNRMAAYDAIAGLNFSHFLQTEEGQKKILALAAIPMALAYAWAFAAIIARARQAGHLDLYLAFILVTILFMLVTGSVLEYGENMRYRYEIQPLFLIVFARAISLKRVGMKNGSTPLV